MCRCHLHAEVLPQNDDHHAVEGYTEEVHDGGAARLRQVDPSQHAHGRPEQPHTGLEDYEGGEDEHDARREQDRGCQADSRRGEHEPEQLLRADLGLAQELEYTRADHHSQHEGGKCEAVRDGLTAGDPSAVGSGQCWCPLQHECVHGGFEEALDQAQVEDPAVLTI